MTSALQLALQVAPLLASRAEHHDREATYPKDDVDDLRRVGLLGLMVPRDLGGLGGGFEDYVHVAAELAAASPSTALIFNMHSAVVGSVAELPEAVMAALGDRGSAGLTRVLREAAAGTIYGVAISEEGDTSPLTGRRTTYTPEGDGFRVRGEKVACSGAGHLDAYLVAAAAAADPQLVSYFVVPAGPGVEAHGSWDPLGMRATASRRLSLDVAVAADRLLGGMEGVVVPLAHAMPQWLTASYAAVYVGVAEAAVRALADDLAGRSSVPGHRRAVLGRCLAAVEAARSLLVAAAREVDARPGAAETNRLVYAAKLVAGDTAARVAQDAAETGGLRTLSRGQPLERIYRDARMGSLMPPRSDVAADILGAYALGGDSTDLEVPPW